MPASVLLSRTQVRQLRKAVHRELSAQAAEELLADSVRRGHDKLALHRYLTLHSLDEPRCAPYEVYCNRVADKLPDETLHRILRHVHGELAQCGLKLGHE